MHNLCVLLIQSIKVHCNIILTLHVEQKTYESSQIIGIARKHVLPIHIFKIQCNITFKKIITHCGEIIKM